MPILSKGFARVPRSALSILATAALVWACGEGPTAPAWRPAGSSRPAFSVPSIVISQVYGGGGNSGSTFKNDFIELFNPGAVSVNVNGWSVQYASAAGTTWQVTNLTNVSIPAGGYYLVQEAVGAGGAVSLPTPDATGAIPMSATAGKVILVSTTTAQSGTCPASPVDAVSFGSTATDCGFGLTPAPSNTNAVLRGNGGCTYNQTLATDFTAGAPTPRNSASATHACGVAPQPVATVTVSPVKPSILTGSTQPFTAAAKDASNNPVSTTFTWSSSNTGVATIDINTGVATGVSAGTTIIQATTPNNVSDTTTLTVDAPPPAFGDVVISQVYAGGGNSGAQFTNDFVELFNHGTTSADITGWKVWYTSAAGTSWTQSVTLPSFTLAPGQYYLIQLAAGAASPAPLPTPDASGSINMGATAGKVILGHPGFTPNVSCPVDPNMADRVAYGVNATTDGCGTQWNGRTAATSNSSAAFRLGAGCLVTGSGSDWDVDVPAPRNSASPTHACVTNPPSSVKLVINEIMADPLHAAGGSSWGEWFEVYNTGTSPVDMQGFTLLSGGGGQANHIISSPLVIAPGAYAVLGRGNDPALNGGITLDYNYFTGTNTIFLDATDFLVIHDGGGLTVDSVRWTNSATFVKGVTRGLVDPNQPHANVDGSSWGWSTTTFGDGDFGTPRAANGTLTQTPPAVPNSLLFSGRFGSDPALPVGYEDQLFATEINGNGDTILTTITWTAMTPQFATIDQDGVMHSVADGQAQFRAEAADHTFGVYSLPMATATASTTAQYGNNTEFGDPVDADNSDDFIIRRAEYTTSYSYLRNTPNWVAYDLDASHFGGNVDRCDCFTMDPALPNTFAHLTTASYTGAGAFAGYGIDRGHMTRSFDRTSGALDNAHTYLLSNVIPQAADLNQGPWANMENFLGDLARNQNKEVYIITGPAGNKGTVKNLGIIVIPTSVWKVAVIMPRDQGLADIHDYRDLEVIAVIMPNDPGVRNVDWHTYANKTVDDIEALTGYDLLSLLPDKVERIVEAGIKPPIAAVDGPYSSQEASPVTMSGSGSVDPNGTITTYAWDFGDNTTGSGATVSHTYTKYGNYPVRLIVTDNDALADTIFTTASVSDVVPVVNSFTGATLLPGETYSASGSFTDPGIETWTASVNYGDGSGTNPLSLSGQTFTLSHTYTVAGSFTVAVNVDDGQASGTGTQNVTVMTQVQGLQSIIAMVEELVQNRRIERGTGNALEAKLNAAIDQLGRNRPNPAANQINAFINQVNGMVNAHRLTAAEADPLTSLANRVIRSLPTTYVGD